MGEVVEVVVTSPVEWMQPFVDELLAERLIACAHQVRIDTTYRWEGAVQHEQEARAMLHTSQAALAALLERIERAHPYDVPCVMTTVMRAPESYASWVAQSTSRP